MFIFRQVVIDVTVGAGGAKGATGVMAGNGGNSILLGWNAIGGGAGGMEPNGYNYPPAEITVALLGVSGQQQLNLPSNLWKPGKTLAVLLSLEPLVVVVALEPLAATQRLV